VIYSTIIINHPTVIKHQIPQPTTIEVHEENARAMSLDSSITFTGTNKWLPEGAYSIPVKIDSELNKDLNLKVYVGSNFIYKEEKIKENSQKQLSSNLDPDVFLKINIEKDIKEFTDQFNNKKDTVERINSCIYLYDWNFNLINIVNILNNSDFRRKKP